MSVHLNFRMEPGSTPRSYPRVTRRYVCRVLDAGVGTAVKAQTGLASVPPAQESHEPLGSFYLKSSARNESLLC